MPQTRKDSPDCLILRTLAAYRRPRLGQVLERVHGQGQQREGRSVAAGHGLRSGAAAEPHPSISADRSIPRDGVGNGRGAPVPQGIRRCRGPAVPGALRNYWAYWPRHDHRVVRFSE